MKNLKLKLTIIGISLLSINAFSQDYVYNGIKNVEATIGMNNSESDSEKETVSADCYDSANIGKRIQAQGCKDLLIVDKSLKPKNFSTVIVNVHDELMVKNFVKEKDEQFLTSGSKKIEDKIIINNDSEIFIWGVVTYVIHSVY